MPAPAAAGTPRLPARLLRRRRWKRPCGAAPPPRPQSSAPQGRHEGRLGGEGREQACGPSPPKGSPAPAAAGPAPRRFGVTRQALPPLSPCSGTAWLAAPQRPVASTPRVTGGLGKLPERAKAAWDRAVGRARRIAPALPLAPGVKRRRRGAPGRHGDGAVQATRVVIDHSGISGEGKSLQRGANMREKSISIKWREAGRGEPSCLCHALLRNAWLGS